MILEKTKQTIKDKARQPIEKLQAKVKIDLFYLLKNEFWLMLGKGISMSSSLVLAWFWANWVDKSVYGYYQYVLSVVGIISIFSLPEMGSAVVRAVARGMEGSMMAGFKSQLRWGALTSLASLSVAGYYFYKGNNIFPLVFLVVAFFLPLLNAANIYISFLMGRKRFDMQVKYGSLNQIILASAMASTLVILKIFFTGLTVPLTLLTLIIVYFSFQTGLYVFFLIRTKTKFKPNRKHDPATITFGKHLTASGIIDIVAGNIDRILLFYYLGPANLAIYSFAALGPQQFKTLISHINDLTLPKFSIRTREEIRRTLPKKLIYLTILISLITLVYVFAAPLLYRIFFPKYLAAVPYSQVYAFSMIPLCLAIGSVLRAQKMIKEIYIIRTLGPIFRIIIFVVLISNFGIWGAVFGMLSARLFSAGLSLYFLRKI